jgi:putative endonuclease
MENDHLILGARGEDLAERYLIRKGYTILERNWKNRHEEIDIIACIDSWLVIVEVKSRSSKNFGPPYESIGIKKQRLLVNAAEAYIMKHNSRLETRFDVVSIIRNSVGHEISHIEGAFSPFD